MFEWDPRKAAANAAKHGVSFDEAVSVFLDANGLDGADVQHLGAEDRFSPTWTLGGWTSRHDCLTVRRSGNVEAIRIISARRASRRERAAYLTQD